MYAPRQFREGPEDERRQRIKSIFDSLALYCQPATANGEARYATVSGEMVAITQAKAGVYYAAFFQGADSLRPAKVEAYRVQADAIHYYRITASTDEEAMETARVYSQKSESYQQLPDEEIQRLDQFFRGFEDRVFVTERTLMDFAELVETYARQSPRPVPPEEEAGGELVSVEHYRAGFQADAVSITVDYALYQSASAREGEFRDFIVTTREEVDGVQVVATYAYEDDTGIATRAVHAEPLPGTPASAVPTFSASEQAFTELSAKRLLSLLRRATYQPDYHRDFAPNPLDRAPQPSTSLAVQRLLMRKLKTLLTAWEGRSIVEWLGPVQAEDGAPQQLRITYFKKTADGASDPNAPFLSLIWTDEHGEEEIRIYRTGGMQRVMRPRSSAHEEILATGQPALNEREARLLLTRLQRQLGSA